MKPEFSKPFDLAHAAAGAPVGKVGGGTARFVAYAEEADPSCCVVVIEDRFNLIGTRRKSCRVNEVGATDNPNDLVMLPLGLIDGKPVFVGDELVGDAGESLPQVVKAFVGITLRDGHLWRWPAPAKMYPMTTMTNDDLWTAQRQADSHGFSVDEFRAIANAALRHAVDADQVVPVSEAKPGMRPHCPYTGKLRDPGDIETDPMGVLVRHVDEPLPPARDRSEESTLVISNVGTVHGDKFSIDRIYKLLRQTVGAEFTISINGMI